MIRKQVFIKEDQAKRLKLLAAKMDVAEAALVREGIDMVLEKKEEKDDWKQAWRQAAGMWADHDDIDDIVAKNRKSWSQRVQKTTAEMRDLGKKE